jgi:hypothetical protein
MQEEKIKNFINKTKEIITIDFHHDVWIVENKSFNTGEDDKIKCQGKASTLEIALDNFLYDWEKQNRKTIELDEQYVLLF